jgi:Sec-independent protein translocase protein TatA
MEKEMGDFKSKLPDLKELGSMAGKLYKGIKGSMTEIVADYKEKRATSEKEAEDTPQTKETKETAKKESPKKEAKAKDKPSTEKEDDEDKGDKKAKE